MQEIIDKENIKADKASLQVIAQKSEGCMRDALSILDKIVSFTNGEVNYQNTLEHLNILDHDYYFRLLDALLAQDMAGAILLYDEINRKGFEGDMVLNGFAEFIRNILVCKDARAIALLDVVEGMDEKYKSVAASVSAGYLVSALNILNEAEINFKMARNKRLHVELVIIKLNFLQQAIQLTSQDGNIIKKKRVDGPVAINYKPVPSIQMITMPATATVNSGGKLLVEEKKQPPVQQKAAIIPITSNVQEPKPQAYTAAQPVANVQTATATPPNKGSILDALRSKYGDKYTIQEVKDPIAITLEALQPHWNHFASKLKEENKISQANAFATSTLEIIDDSTFVVKVDSTLQQKFIEQEKTIVLEYLQRHFYNNLLTFDFFINEGERETTPLVRQMNSKERFDRIAQNYPLLRTLKENLKLEIDRF